MREVWTKSWNVNVVGAQVLTNALIPLLLRSDDPRILFLSSRASSLGIGEIPNIPVNRSPPKGWPKSTGGLMGNVPAYRSAKAGLNMMMR
jgi:NAD(P)-dependent dehydrogenase (short-subunit alcohol dehydrogenase family)